MSKILRRPMFRGGGKVSSYGNGIATGLADGGMPSKRGLVDGPGGYAGEQFGGFVNKVTQSPYDSGRATTGGSIMNRLRNIPYLGRAIPAMGGTAGAIGSQVVLPATIGAGLGGLADFYAKSTSTPEGYRRLKEMGGANFNFDETNPDVGEVFEYIDEGNTMGEKPGFFPRGGKDKFYEEQGYLPDGTKIKVEEEVEGGESNELSIEERIAKIQAEERAKYQEMIDMAMGTKKSSKEKIAENKKIFEEALGGGKKAKIQDASNMALSFAGKALKEGATVKSSFADFFDEESKRPSRSEKVSDAAGQAAIQAYLTGEQDYNTMMKQMKLIDYKTDKAVESARSNQTTDSLLEAFAGNNGDRTDEGVMQATYNTLYKETDPQIFQGKIPEDVKDLIVGKVYYADDPKNTRTKIIFLIQADGTPKEINRILK